MVRLGLIGDGADGARRRAILGNVAKEVDVLRQVIPLSGHGIHHADGCQGILVRPVGILDGILQAVGLDGVEQPVGIVPPVAVHRQQIQLVLALQAGWVTVPRQQIVKKAQVKVGVVGCQQGVAPNQRPDFGGGLLPGDALGHHHLGGDAGKPLNFRGHRLPGSQLNQAVVLLGDGNFTVLLLQQDGRKLDDFIFLEIQPGGLGVKNQNAFVPGK